MDTTFTGEKIDYGPSQELRPEEKLALRREIAVDSFCTEHDYVSDEILRDAVLHGWDEAMEYIKEHGPQK